jgi:hypothetical protein
MNRHSGTFAISLPSRREPQAVIETFAGRLGSRDQADPPSGSCGHGDSRLGAPDWESAVPATSSR